MTRADRPGRGTRTRRGAWLVVLLALALLIPPVAFAQSDAPVDGARVRIVHGVPDLGPVDVYIDGGLAVIGASFPSVTDPLSIAAGERRITVTPSGSGPDQALVDSTVAIQPGTTDEIAILGSASDFDARLFPIDRSLLAPGKARLRVVHGSPDAGPLDPVVSGGDAIFPTLDYLTASEYADVTAGPYPLLLNASGAGYTVLDASDLVLDPNTVADIYVVGSVADNTIQTLIVTSDVEAPPPVEGVSASVHAGTCQEPGDLVAPVGVVAAPNGATVGSGGGVVVERGFATIPNTFDDVTNGDRVLLISPSAERVNEVLACGVLSGALTEDGSLVAGLLNDESREPAGVVVLSPSVLDPDATDISVFLLPGGAKEEDTAAATAAPASTPRPIRTIATPIVTGG